jgi:hypothetical protein
MGYNPKCLPSSGIRSDSGGGDCGCAQRRRRWRRRRRRLRRRRLWRQWRQPRPPAGHRLSMRPSSWDVKGRGWDCASAGLVHLPCWQRTRTRGSVRDRRVDEGLPTSLRSDFQSKSAAWRTSCGNGDWLSIVWVVTPPTLGPLPTRSAGEEERWYHASQSDGLRYVHQSVSPMRTGRRASTR